MKKRGQAVLRVHFDGANYIAIMSINKKKLATDAGFIWDPVAKRFSTAMPQIAYRLLEFCDEETKAHIERELGIFPVKADFSRINWPEGLSPFPHQVEFTKWMLTRRRSYIAGEPGTGKTGAAVMAMNAKPGPTIIICPSFLALNWKKEIEMWSTWAAPPRIDIVKNKLHFFDADADVFIVPVSFLAFDHVREFFFREGRYFTWVFADESHYFKNEETKRTQAYFGGRVLVGNKKKVWKGFHTIADHTVNLSGTPMPNGRPLELWPCFERQAPHAVDFMSKHEFATKYCDAFFDGFGWSYKGASNLEEFHEKISRQFMLAKRLDDCVDLPEELPPKLIYLKDDRPKGEREVESEVVKLLRNVKIENLVVEEVLRNPQFAERIKHLYEKIGEDVFVENPFQFLSELRKYNGFRKVPHAAEIIKEVMKEDGPVVVFAWHKEVVRALSDRMARQSPLVITGETSMQKRQQIVDQFQTSKDHNLLIANIQSAGVGLTLTKASRCIFLEPSFVPGENDQALRRVRRIGQTRPSQGMFLIFEDSIDHLILNAHQRKGRNVSRGIFGQ